MIIRKAHALSLLNVREEELKKASDYKFFSEDPVFLELDRMDLLTMEVPFEYSLTYWGRVLSDLLLKMVKDGLIEHPSSWDSRFRWIGSEVIAMIENSLRNDGIPGKKIESELLVRGFLERKNGVLVLNSYGREVFDIFQKARPKLIVDRDLYEYIKSMPSGPGESTLLPSEERFPILMGAMRLIAFSIPTSDIYALTALGQEVKNVCENLVPSRNTLISQEIMSSLKKASSKGFDNLSSTERELLISLAYLDEEGKLLPAGEHLLKAYRIWKAREFRPVKTIDIERFDVEVIFAIEKIWEDHRKGSSVVPSVDEISKYLSDRIKGSERLEKLRISVQESLFSLESFDLVTLKEFEGERVYHLTGNGLKVLKDMRDHGVRDIPAVAVKAITVTGGEISSPNVEWYRESVNAHLIGEGEVTESGKMYAELSYNVRRVPFITALELEVLNKLPERGLFVYNLPEIFPELSEREISRVLNKLEARGFIDILQSEAIIVTEAGKLLRKALSGLPEGLAIPITPTGVKVLDSLKKAASLQGDQRALPKDIKKAIEISGLDSETFGNEMLVLKSSNLIGKTSFNEAGLTVLKVLEELNYSESS